MSRKNLLAHVAGSHVPGAPESDSEKSVAPRAQLSVRGPAGTITRSIDELVARTTAAEEIAARFAGAENVVEVDPALIDPSFAQDRMGAFDPEGVDAEFVAAIRDQGQIVPALLRPSPHAPGRYQPAYGRRRIAAAAFLGRKVRALVRALTNEELVVAQGQENEARNGLTFIEKCRFAATLEEQGFKRKVIETALKVGQADLSKMLQVIAEVPPEVVEWIGPAAEVGRPRWMALAAIVSEEKSKKRAKQAISEEIMAGAIFSGPARLAHVLAALTEKEQRRKPSPWSLPGQKKPYGSFEVTPKRVTLTVERSANPAIAEALIGRIEEIRREIESAAEPSTANKKG